MVEWISQIFGRRSDKTTATLTSEIVRNHKQIEQLDRQIERYRETVDRLNSQLGEAEQAKARYRKEAKCRQSICGAIARYFIVGERTTGGESAIRFEDVKIDSNPAWIPDILARSDLSEPEFIVFKYFDDDDDGTILDIGANYGYGAASIWAAGASSKILSFEPNPWHIPCLAKIKELRPKRFDYANLGLGAASKETRFVIPVIEGVGISALSSASIELETAWTIPENILNHMMVDHPDLELPRLQFAEVLWHTERLDDVLRDAGFDVGISSIPAVKIDVEGFEADVLRGAPQMLSTHKPLIMIEGANRSEDVMSLLTAAGYRYADLEGDHVVLSDKPSPRSNGFFLHEDKLDHYRTKGVLGP